MKKKRIQYLLFMFFFLMSIISYSQGKRKDPPFPKENGPGPYPELPIDGGLSILLIVGTAYGIYELRRKK